MKFRLVSIVKKPFFRFVMTLLAAIFDFEHNSAIARKDDYLGVSGKNFSQTGRVKRVQVRSFFWSIFSRVRTEYGDLLRQSPYSVQIRENPDQRKHRIWTLFP